MRLRRTLTLLLSLCVFAPVLADDPDDESEGPGESDAFMDGYYLDKKASELPDFLKSLQRDKSLDEHESAVNPISGFLAAVFLDNPSDVTRFAKCAKFTGKTREAVERALWLSGHAKVIKDVFGETPDFVKKGVTLKNVPIEGPEGLDTMWGAFLGSGDVAYAKRVIDVLDEDYPLQGEDEWVAAARKSAEWSLKSFMMEHELVYRLIRKEAKTRKGDVRKILNKMLSSIKDVSLPNKDGDFSAMLALMDEEELEEFKKPSHEGIRINETAKAHRGDTIAIKVMFVGMKLTDDLKVDVCYDLKVLGPDGEVYEKTDMKDLKALSRKLQTRFRIYDNLDVPMIRFEAKDKLGKYRIMVTVRDRIGDKSVNLEKTIELKK